MGGPGKVVQGPDGKVIQFPDNMDDSAINQAMSGMYGGGQQKQTQMSMPAKPPQPQSSNTGVWPAIKRVASGIFNMPGDVAIAATKPPQTLDEQSLATGTGMIPGGPEVALAAKRLIVDPMQAEAQLSRNMTQVAQQTGNPDAQHLANMHAIASGVPVVGPMAASLVQRYLLGDKSGALTEGAGYVAAPEVTNRLLNVNLPKNPLRGTPEQALSRTIMAKGDVPYRESIQVAKPDLDRAAQQVPVSSIQDVNKVVEQANQNFNNEFQTALKPIANQETVPISVADEIKKNITPGMMKTAEGRAVAAVLKRRALEFENQKWTWSELNDERMNAYARTAPFNNASAEAQATMTKAGRANLIADRAILQATRDAVYDAMDQYHNKNLQPGQTPYDFSAMKRRQAALMDIKWKLEQEIPRVENETDVLKGSGLLERGHVSTYGHPESGRIGTSVHNIQNLFSTPESRANAAAQRAFVQLGRPGLFPAPATATPPVPAVNFNSYPTAQSIMLGMKTGDLTPDQGARMLQKMRKSASAGQTHRRSQPETPSAPMP